MYNASDKTTEGPPSRLTGVRKSIYGNKVISFLNIWLLKSFSYLRNIDRCGKCAFIIKNFSVLWCADIIQ